METIQLNIEMSQYFILIDSLGRAFYDIKKDIIEQRSEPFDTAKKLQMQSFCGIANLYKQCLDVGQAEFPEHIAVDLYNLADKTIFSVIDQGLF